MGAVAETRVTAPSECGKMEISLPRRPPLRIFAPASVRAAVAPSDEEGTGCNSRTVPLL